MPLGDPQVHQREGSRIAQPHPDGTILTEGKTVSLPVHGGGGPLYGGYAVMEPIRRGPRFLDQLFRTFEGTRLSFFRDGAPYSRYADQLLTLFQMTLATPSVICPAHPAGPQPHGLGGQDQLLAKITAFFIQIRIGGGSREQKIIGCAPDPAPVFGKGGKGVRSAADQANMEP